MINMKKINNISVVEEVLETDTVLGERDGAAVRLPAGALGGSGGAFVVNVTGNNTDGYTADKTFAEIQEAYDNGMHIELRYEENEGHVFVLPLTQTYDGGFCFMGGCAYLDSNEYFQRIVELTAGGEVIVDQEIYNFGSES